MEWLSKRYNNQKITKHSMLLIDDESDYASINTNKTDEDPTKINARIRDLLGLFECICCIYSNSLCKYIY